MLHFLYKLRSTVPLALIVVGHFGDVVVHNVFLQSSRGATCLVALITGVFVLLIAPQSQSSTVVIHHVHACVVCAWLYYMPSLLL